MYFIDNSAKEKRKRQADSEDQPTMKKRKTRRNAFRNKCKESINPSSTSNADLSNTKIATLYFPKKTRQNNYLDYYVDLPILPFVSTTIQWTDQRRFSNVNPHEKQAFDMCLKIQSEMNKVRDMLWTIGKNIIQFDNNMFPQNVSNFLKNYQTLDEKIIMCQKHFEAVNFILHPENVWN